MQVTPFDSNWQPSTFRERGVAVPFTSPMLAGARVRTAERRCDLVVPHPGGARGVYIFALSALGEFCAPTLHDMRLAELLKATDGLTPSTVRRAARAVASEGAAGRPAAAAAAAAVRQEQAAFCAIERHLLQFAEREGGAVHRLAGRTGRSADAVRADVQRLAELLVSCGLMTVAASGGAAAPVNLPPSCTGGRCALLIESLGGLRDAFLAWANGTDPAGLMVAASAAAFAAAGQSLLDALRPMLDDPLLLLRAWASRPAELEAELARPDWLLDGWQTPCLLWNTAAGDTQRAAASAEISVLLPPFPPEAEAWFPKSPDLLARLRAQQSIRPQQPRTRPPIASDAVTLVGRNERLRVLAA